MIANSKKGRFYLLVKEIHKKVLNLKGSVVGKVKVPQSIYARRIIIIPDLIDELREANDSHSKRINHLKLKIQNNTRDIKILKRLKKRVGELLCQDGASSAKGSESDSSKKKPKRKVRSSNT